MPRARITPPAGKPIVVNVGDKELERLSALQGYRIELLPDRVFVPGERWLYNDIRNPAGDA